MSNAEHITLLQKRLWRMLHEIILKCLQCTTLYGMLELK